MSVKIMREDGTLETVSGMAAAGVSMSEWTEGGVYKGVSFASATSTFNLMPVSFEQDSSGATEIWDRNVPGGQRKATIPGFGVELSNHTLAFAYPSGGGSTIQSAVMCLSGHTHEPAQAGVTLTGTGDQVLKVGGDTATILNPTTVTAGLTRFDTSASSRPTVTVYKTGVTGNTVVHEFFREITGNVCHYHIVFYAWGFSGLTGTAATQHDLFILGNIEGTPFGRTGTDSPYEPCVMHAHNGVIVQANFNTDNHIVYVYTTSNTPSFTTKIDFYTQLS